MAAAPSTPAAPSPALEGRLVTASGVPLPGYVSAVSDAGTALNATLDERGAFSLPTTPGHWRLAAQDARGFPVATAELEVGPGGARLELVAPLPARIAGRVADAPEGALVRVHGAQGGTELALVDADGSFALELPPGSYTLEAADLASLWGARSCYRSELDVDVEDVDRLAVESGERIIIDHVEQPVARAPRGTSLTVAAGQTCFVALPKPAPPRPLVRLRGLRCEG